MLSASSLPRSVSELTEEAAHDLTQGLVQSCASLSLDDPAITATLASRRVTAGGNGIGLPPPCGFEGCSAPCTLLADQSGYSTFCTGEVHPPTPRPICSLAGCQSACYPLPDFTSWYDYCGRTHGQTGERRRRDALETRADQNFALGTLARSHSGTGTTQIARSDGIMCRGCSQSIRLGGQMEVFAEGFIHPNFSCRSAAEGRRVRDSSSRVGPVAREDVV